MSELHNKRYFNDLITSEYADDFNGENVDDVLEKLRAFTGEALAKVMSAIFKVADERNLMAMKMNTTGLCDWIREVIKANKLKAIVFIWDEFTDYLRSNRNLTGFQELCEISATDPFYFILVSHKTQSLYHEHNEDYRKLNGRFVSPHCHINLPDNIAFQLLGAAMEKKTDKKAGVDNKDKVLAENWEKILADLADRTEESRRKLVKSIAHIEQKDLMNILPIHPYAALILKYLSAMFESNQRSMFDFIKNDPGDEIKGFQYFINHHGPYDENPLLTVDALWDFFYEKSKESLAPEIRSTLDVYHRMGNQRLNDEQKRVLKTVLLLKAISQKVGFQGEQVQRLLPTEENLELAFEGTDVTCPQRCANNLVNEHVLYSRQIGDGKSQYDVYNYESDVDIKPYEEEIDKKKIHALIQEEFNGTKVADAVKLQRALALRYELFYVSESIFDTKIREIRNNAEKYENRIVGVVCFAKNESDANVVGQKIRKAIAAEADVVFIDATGTPFGTQGYEAYRKNMALSMSQHGKDNTLARQYADDAKEALKAWKTRISSGDFFVYSKDKPKGERVANLEALYRLLEKINQKKFPSCLEAAYKVTDEMYEKKYLQKGVEYGCNEDPKSGFRSSNPNTRLDLALEGAWKVPEYWKSRPELLISKIKKHVDNIISESIQKDGGRVSFRKIYDALKVAPYGFMPCNLTAFILGFLLKEYARGEYSWSDENICETLDVKKLGESLKEVLDLNLNSGYKYSDKYIVATTPEEKAFHQLAAEAFGIEPSFCSSIPNTREEIRKRMKDYSFPIWTLKFILKTRETKTKSDTLEQILDLFCGIANNNNLPGFRSENDIATELGRLAQENSDAASDLKALLTTEECQRGMVKYLKTFEDGRLVDLANEIRDNGKYIPALKQKIDAEAANWLWNIETVESKIREVILEYEIIAESNKTIVKNLSYDATIGSWRDRCNRIKISYNALKNCLEEPELSLGRFLEKLCALQSSRALSDSEKKPFLDLLRENADSFRNFYENQINYFKRVCQWALNNLEEEEIREVFNNLPGCFNMDKDKYLTAVEDRVKKYQAGRKINRLKELWKKKTDSDSPREWSQRNLTPILCLIPDSEIQEARNAFAAINRPKADDASVERAITYLSEATFFESLHDKTALENAFRDRIVKRYAVILNDIDKVKKELSNKISAEPFDWFGLPEVDQKLKEMADYQYNKGGYRRIQEKIQEMDVEDVKKYILELIERNMEIGLEIMKEQRKRA